MTDIPASVGWIEVNAVGVFATADSSDAGDPPDAIPMQASVKFTASVTKPVVALAEKKIVTLAEITCLLDVNGVLRPPSGGESGAIDAGGTLRLVAPNQDGISTRDWTWTATFTPLPNERWRSFSIVFDGAPGDVVNLADRLSDGTVESVGTPSKGVVDALLAASLSDTTSLSHAELESVVVSTLADDPTVVDAAVVAVNDAGLDGATATNMTAPGSATKAVLDQAIGAAPADVSPRSGRFDPARSTYLPPGAVLRRTRAKFAAVQAQITGARLKIALQGHSEMVGYGGSPGLTSLGVLLRKMIGASGYPVGTGWVLAYNNIGSGITHDGRWSYNLGGGAWEYAGMAAGTGAMQCHLRSLTAGNKAVLTSDTPGTVVDIATFGTSAPFTYGIDGAAAVTVTPTGASAVEVTTITGLPDTRHTVVIRATSSAATYLLAAAVRPASAVEVSAFGLSGSRALDHLPGQPYYSPYAVLDAYNPDCVIVQLDVNEALNAVSVATFATNMASIVTAHKAAGRDVILASSIGPNDVTPATWTTYRQAIYNLADTAGVPLVDFGHRLGTYAQANGAGLMFDTTHPNAAGYADSAQAILATLANDGVTGIARPADTIIYAADNFARPDSSSAGSTEIGSATWAATGGGVLSISANRLVNTGATATESDAYVDDGKSDGTVQLTLTSMAAHNGIVFRSASTTDGYVFWRNATTRVYTVSQRTAVGTYTTLLTVPTIVAVTGDVLKVVLNGATVRCYINGELVHTFTDAANVTKTRHGLWRANIVASVSADSFSHTGALT